MDAELYSFSFKKLFMGEFSAGIYLELFIRALIIFVYILIMGRILGKRVKGQVASPDLIMIIILGAAAGAAMFNPEIPLLHAIFVMTLVVVFEKIVAYSIQKKDYGYSYLVGFPHILVKNGVIDVPNMEKALISREELMMLLRQQGIRQLGQVKEAYLEPSGQLSVYTFGKDEVKRGMSVRPYSDGHKRLGEKVSLVGEYSCTHCGSTKYLEEGTLFPSCGNCKWDEWLPAEKND